MFTLRNLRDTVITIKYILIECADLVEVRKKYLEERSLYSLFRNVIAGAVLDFLREKVVCSIKNKKKEVCLSNVCVQCFGRDLL